MGAGGVIVPPRTYFPRLREICDRHDVLLIADEVITGFGRTGKLVRPRPLGRRARHRVLRQGRHQRLSAARRRHRVEARARGDPGRAGRPRSSCTRRPIPAIRCAAPSASPISRSSRARAWSSAPRCMGKRLLAGLETLRDAAGCGRGARPRHDGRGRTGRPTRARKEPAIGLGRQGRRARRWKRGLILRLRGGSRTDRRPSGDTLCLAPPLMTPEATLDRIVQILGN